MQTQLTPKQIEVLFVDYMEYLKRNDRQGSCAKVAMNLREISSYNVEVIKERYLYIVFI